MNQVIITLSDGDEDEDIDIRVDFNPPFVGTENLAEAPHVQLVAMHMLQSVQNDLGEITRVEA